jgi:hypothetical protein
MVVIDVSFHIVRSTENARSLSTCGIVAHVHNSPYNFDILQIGPTFSLVGMHELEEYEKLTYTYHTGQLVLASLHTSSNGLHILFHAIFFTFIQPLIVGGH